MTTDKRFAYNQAPDKGPYRLPISIQSTTPSANDNHQHTNEDPSIVVIIDDNNNVTNRNVNSDSSNILNYRNFQLSTTRSLFLSQLNAINTTSSTSIDSEDSPTPPPNYHEIPGIVPSYHGRASGPPPPYDDIVNPNASPPSYQSLFGQVREARKTSNGLVDLARQLLLILIGTLGCTMIIGFLLLIPITMILVGTIYVNDCKAENIPSFLVIGGLVWIVKNILNCYNQFKKDSTINRPPPRRIPITRTATITRNNSTISGDLASNESSIEVIDINNNNLIPISQNMTQSESQIPTTTATSTSTTTRINSNLRESQITNRIRHPTMIGLTSFKCESMLNYFLIVWFLAGCIVVYRIYEPDYENPLSSSYCNRTVYLYAFWLMTSAFIIMAIVLSCLCCLMASSLMSCNQGR